MSGRKYVVDALQELIQISRDGQNGYRGGAEHAKDPQLRRFLDSVSLARAKFAGDLESHAVRLGKTDVDRSGSALGAIHRGWTDLKANLGGGDDTILSSMETGDSYAKERYDKYIKSAKLPDDILGTIRNQAQTIVGTLDRVRAMRQHRQVQSEAA
ncbi:MAG: PA2169 family four-helix-bundle protein [Candidatus Korobacteraceae bacterium]